MRAFWLLAVLNVFVGSMVGMERTVLPLIAGSEFGLGVSAGIGGFVVAFALTKAVVNLFAGASADRFGRRGTLVAGWALTLPVAPILAWAPTWEWVMAANVLLGAGQAMTWSMTVNMMVDLVPASRRGFAAGINEFAGYLGVGLAALGTGLVAAELGPRPWPFLLGGVLALIGLGLSFATEETAPVSSSAPWRWTRGVGVPSLLGFATNLKDGVVWIGLPVVLTERGASLPEVAFAAALYPLLWAFGQPLFGTLSDRMGRWPLISGGTLLQGAGLAVLAEGGADAIVGPGIVAAALLGLGTGMVYPVLIAAVADRVAVEERASALGIYRFCRDSGYAVGAIAAGAAITALSPLLTWSALAFLPLAAVPFLARSRSVRSGPGRGSAGP